MDGNKDASCKAETCKHDSHKRGTRGVCQTCRAGATKLIREGHASDDDLVQMGLLEPIQQRGPKTTNPPRVRAEESSLEAKFWKKKAKKSKRRSGQ